MSNRTAGLYFLERFNWVLFKIRRLSRGMTVTCNIIVAAMLIYMLTLICSFLDLHPTGPPCLIALSGWCNVSSVLVNERLSGSEVDDCLQHFQKLIVRLIDLVSSIKETSAISIPMVVLWKSFERRCYGNAGGLSLSSVNCTLLSDSGCKKVWKEK